MSHSICLKRILFLPRIWEPTSHSIGNTNHLKTIYLKVISSYLPIAFQQVAIRLELAYFTNSRVHEVEEIEGLKIASLKK